LSVIFTSHETPSVAIITFVDSMSVWGTTITTWQIDTFESSFLIIRATTGLASSPARPGGLGADDDPE